MLFGPFEDFRLKKKKKRKVMKLMNAYLYQDHKA